MPDFSSELSKSMNQLGFAMGVVLWNKKEVPQGSNTHQRLNGDIDKISLFDIIQSHLQTFQTEKINIISMFQQTSQEEFWNRDGCNTQKKAQSNTIPGR